MREINREFKNNDLEGRFQMFRDAVDTMAYNNFERVAQRAYKYVFEEQPMGSNAYNKRTQEKFALSRELQNEPIDSFKDYSFFKNTKRHEFINKVQFGYMARMLNTYLHEKMGLSDEQVRTYFRGKSDFERFFEYETTFKDLFVDLAIKLLGGESIATDFLTTRKTKAEIASGYTYPTEQEQNVCIARAEALQIAVEIAQLLRLDRVDLRAMYDSQHTLDYDILAHGGSRQVEMEA